MTKINLGFLFIAHHKKYENWSWKWERDETFEIYELL